ncbi:(5-formylfuran-3-yl)methyl phosphate synthase [Singulisphaera sp. Ch08]|uniref:(5-formylfuran-3-yl)methyl phosphate synthase n=1 Tax=Singulisphaera sp. Ch08 TaxID=3120278 RepID=A0AAU7CDW6_9BACT
MPRLLVSVRSVEEALVAFAGGASIIDLKEPARGPLGRADTEVWQASREMLPAEACLSVALGELPEWTDQADPSPSHFAGISYRKLGLAGVGADWRTGWANLRDRWGEGPAWVAVVYSDWPLAQAPEPTAVLDEALAVAGCTGILIDTWDKSSPSTVGRSWIPWLARARQGGLTVALAGGLNESRIERLAPLDPDWIAVRGAACHDGDRGSAIDPARVARLARLVKRMELE